MINFGTGLYQILSIDKLGRTIAILAISLPHILTLETLRLTMMLLYLILCLCVLYPAIIQSLLMSVRWQVSAL